ARDVARLPPGPEVGGRGEGESPLAAAGERRTPDRLRPLAAQLELSEHAAEDGERRAVIAPHERGDLGDAGHAGVGDELLDERRADAAPLIRIRDLEGDLRTGPRTHETCDRHRPRITVDVGHQRVVLRVDRGEPAQLLLPQPGLRAVETRPPRIVAEPLEERLDGGSVAVPQRPDEELRPMLRFHTTRVHAY